MNNISNNSLLSLLQLNAKINAVSTHIPIQFRKCSAGNTIVCRREMALPVYGLKATAISDKLNNSIYRVCLFGRKHRFLLRFIEFIYLHLSIYRSKTKTQLIQTLEF